MAMQLCVGGQETKSAVKRQRRRSWGLHEPFAGHEIFEEYHSSTPIEQHSEITT